jgi:hypothetical protein
MSNVTSPAAPVDVRTTHRFQSGPFDQFTVRFPRPSVLDDRSTNCVAFPRGEHVEAALAWGDVVGFATDPPPMEGYAVYRRTDDGTWLFVPYSLKAQTGRH